MNLKSWAPLQLVDSDLLRQVRSAYVFGKTGQEAFIITENDDVFACGPNFSYCLGLNIEGPQLKPVRIPELCQKKVKGFSCAIHREGAAMFVYTSDNKLYFWGKYLEKSILPQIPTMSSRIEYRTKVLEVASGPTHSLILTFNGQVFSFGSNYCGQLGRSSYGNSSASLIEENLRGKFVLKVSCGAQFSVAVLDDGKVFAWGNNTSGQLGVGNGRNEYSVPTKVSALSNVIIKDIICGESYVLAVSNNALLYTWGENRVGQLGLGHTNSCFEPIQLETIKKVIDIAATCYGSTTAAMTKNNEVYMWGACGDMNLTEPTRTGFDNLFDVFAFFGKPKIMHRTMFQTSQLDLICETMKNAFGDSETSDLTVVADGKEIFVHKVILKLRSNYFKVMLQEQWLKGDQKIITINRNYDGLYAYLQYLYTGKFKGNSEVALETLKIAHEYDDIVLKKICEKHVQHSVTVGNVANLYSWAIKLGTKDLAEHCVTIASENIGEIIDAPGFSEWNVYTSKQFIRDHHKLNVYKQKL